MLQAVVQVMSRQQKRRCCCAEAALPLSLTWTCAYALIGLACWLHRGVRVAVVPLVIVQTDVLSRQTTNWGFREGRQ